MSFSEVRETKARINRSELAVPGSQSKFFEKALNSPADVIFLDLEDAVAPDQKAQARKNIIEALNDLDWSSKTVSVRINGLDTHWMYRDIVDVVEQAGQFIDLIMVPKVGTSSDVYALDMLITQIETARGFDNRIGLELIIETALGMQNLAEIAGASTRNESLHFGVADYAASTQARTTNIGGPNPNYVILTDPIGNDLRQEHWGDMWHYALSKMVVVARANGLRPIDGPFGDYSDAEGYKAAAYRASALGCEGKWAIHPSQIVLANEVMSPSEEEIAKARKIVAAMARAEEEGMGAVSLDGKLIDYASIRQAEALISKLG
ncbi:MAG: CoA ester lyase [Paracoccaceae bacterium]|nr:CoA ester lyase [Paracoccaceae bacterium]MCY4099856.1 CoA ester lyase [Paracoccaceae bacterium]MDE2675384.1 CoA ester lyase [Paracoccaceae bacterium]MXZ51203.1 CoA ester lyase [Paracoccaceae bacterium]MYF47346.1 CoA ester lyase [Paracoccaceae bacterium]